MNLYMKQRVFSWRDKFNIYDQNGNEVYYVESEIFTLGKKLHITDMAGNEVGFIHQKLMSLVPRYLINQNGVDVAEVKKQITFLKPKYHVEGPDWLVEGDYFQHEYKITKNSLNIAFVSKKWLSWGDTYEISVMNNADTLLALEVVLIVDAVLAQQRN